MLPGQYIRSVKLTRPLPPGSYLAALPAVQYLRTHDSLDFTQSVTFLVGENGTGKSTLTEAIATAYGFNPEGGTKNFRFSTAATHSALWEYITLVKSSFARDGFFLRAESFYNVASNIDALDRDGDGYGNTLVSSYGGRSLHAQSHGESFLSLVENRFGGNGLYILDEPEAALSPMKLMTLIHHIDRLVRCNSQFIIATHSPILMAFPGAAILELSDAGIRQVDYRETEHYQLTRRFLEAPEKMLRYLLTDD